MKLFSSEQVRQLDSLTSSQYKISSLLLMEHAGLAVATEVRQMVGELYGKRILILCGPGNNGGDGFVTARILSDWGANVQVYPVSDLTKSRGEAKTNADILSSTDKTMFIGARDFPDALSHADCIVDAIFGTGLKRPIEKEMAAVVKTINESQKPIVAVDLPSGIDADNGKILGVAVKATVTVTLGVPKTGLYLYPGRGCAGKVKIAYLPIPGKLIRESPSAARVLNEEEVARLLPRWEPDIHKGDRGKVMVIGGSRGYSGAPALSAMAALHTGSGLVYVAVPDGIRTLMEHKLSEVIKLGFPQTPNWVFGKVSLTETRTWFGKLEALAIGPGIGRAAETVEYVREIVQEYRGPIVIDADGLFALDEKFLLTQGKPTMILTPHEGEMAHLCGLTPEEVHENRFALAADKAKKWNVTLLLKGAATLVASEDAMAINATGNPGMATAGSGDVLTGILVSLLGQGLQPFEAAGAAAFIHGLSADLLAEEIGVRGITSERISTNLYNAFKKLDSLSFRMK